MIEKHQDWPDLLAALRASGALAGGDHSGRAVRAVLAGPCAVAWWIAQRAPELRRRERLSLLIVGAEVADAPDGGRWYQLLPMLLGGRFEVDVTLVGLELDTRARSTLAGSAPPAPAHAHRTSLADYLRRHDAHVDLAFAFHPGLQKHRAWLAPDGFPEILRRRVPLVAVAFEEDEQAMERWVAEAYGYRAALRPLLNPFFLDVSDARTHIRWGRVLWAIDEAPADGVVPDETRLARLDTLNSMVMHSMVNAAHGAPPYGLSVELTNSAGGTLRLLHIADYRFLDPAKREIVHLTAGALTPIAHVPSGIVEAFPGERAPELERAIWAAAVKAEYLLQTYPASSSPPSAALAAEMLSDLRTKLAAMLAGD